MIALLKKRDYL